MIPTNKKIKDKYIVERNTYKNTVKDYTHDRIEIEIGDSKQDDFKPQLKICRWDNEVNFSMRAEEHPEATVRTLGEIIKYVTPDYEVHQYDKPDAGEDGGFEFEWVLPKKPKSNVLRATIETKELDFFYQPELEDDEVREMAEQEEISLLEAKRKCRPENIVGSYAVYHKSKKNNVVGGKEYKTGKAFHIYRPKAIDAEGKEVWCDLHIEKELTVIIPQEFLDKAVYPVTVDPTFGYTTEGASSIPVANSWVQGSKFTSPSDISEADSISCYAKCPSGDGGPESDTFYMAIYTTDATPAFVSNSLTGDLTVDSTSNTLETGSYSTKPSVSASTDYWLLSQSAQSTSDYTSWAYDTGATGQGFNGGSGILGDATLSPTYINNWKLSMYVTYTSSGGGDTDTNDERSAETTGKQLSNSERNAELTGEDTSNSERGSEITGKNTSNSERDAETTGKQLSNSERNAELTGASASTDTNSERNAEIIGKSTSNSERNSELTGKLTANSERNVETTGKQTSNSERNAELTGASASTETNSERNAELTGSLLSLTYETKEYTYKIYDSDGNYIRSWNDVVNEPVFTETINGGLSELTIRLHREENDYGEDYDVAFGNIIKIYAHDDDDVLVYSGKLVSYTPMVDGRTEYVDITFYSFYWELAQYILEDTGATEIAYNSYEPGQIAIDLLDKFTAAGGTADYASGTIEDTGTTVSYTFNTTDYQSALQKVAELCPSGWYYRVGAAGTVYLKERSTTADHTFTLGKDIASYSPEKRYDSVVNTIYFTGGGDPPFYKKFTNTSSVTEYGTMAQKIVDTRVTVEATANIMADKVLDERSNSEIRVVIEILDNNGQAGEAGYDIESIHVGEICKIQNATDKGNNLWDEILWDIDAWDYDITNQAAVSLQIMKKTYYPDYCVLELSNRQPDISKRIEDISRNLKDEQTKDNPSSPS